jgi:sugar lactone lactonase YvrE
MSTSGQIGFQVPISQGGGHVAPDVAGSGVWVTPPAGGTVEHVDNSGTATSLATGLSDFRFNDVTPGPDGREWFLGSGAELVAVDGAGTVTTYKPFGSSGTQGLNSLVAGPDGALWAVGGFIARFTTDGRLTNQYDISSGAGSTMGDIVNGPDGALWFTENDYKALPTPRIGRITTSGGLSWRMLSGTTEIGGLTLGPDGNLWFSYDRGVGRMTLSGDVALYPVTAQQEPDQKAWDVVAGPDGRVWFAANGVVGAITTGGVASLYSVPAAQPVTCSLLPSMGDPAGGTSVRIFGRGFTGATSVTFGQNPAAGFTVVRDTEIDAVSPAGTQGSTVDVTVTTPAGSATQPSGLGYLYQPPPSITAVAPSSGSTAGGNTLTIDGQFSRIPDSVTVGGSAATNVRIVSSTEITVTAPPHVAGTYDVVATSKGAGSALSAADRYTYVAPQPVISSMPAAGSSPGGEDIWIYGSGLTGTTSVSFGGVPAVDVEVINDGIVHCFSPAHADGMVTVTLTTAGGTATAQFDYREPAAVTSISPAKGPTAGGTTVTITGRAFSGATAVDFGERLATSFTVNSDTQITAVSPPGAPGDVDVRVITPLSVSRPVPADRFRYTTPVMQCSGQATVTTTPSTAGGYAWTILGVGTTGRCVDVATGQTYDSSFFGAGHSATLGVCKGGTLDDLDVAMTVDVAPGSSLQERFAIRVGTYPVASVFQVYDGSGNVVGSGLLNTRIFAQCPPQGSDTATLSWAQSV